MDQSQQRHGPWAQPSVPRPPLNAASSRRLADMLATYWNDPAPGGLVEMAKSVVQGVRAWARLIGCLYGEARDARPMVGGRRIPRAARKAADARGCIRTRRSDHNRRNAIRDARRAWHGRRPAFAVEAVVVAANG